MTKITHLTNISSNNELTTTTLINKWQDYYFKIDSQILNNNLISQSLKLL
jgi:hypothetical protein